MRQNQSRAIFALVEKIDALCKSHEAGSTLPLLRDCGLSDDEISTFMAVTAKLGQHKDSVINQGLGYDGIRALVHASNEAVTQAMFLGSARGRLGATELARLREIPESVRISDVSAAHKLRDDCFRTECIRMAEERQHAFTALAKKLHFAIETYKEHLRYVRRYYTHTENLRFLAKHSANGLAVLEQRGAIARALEKAFFIEQENKIIALAKNVLKEFDELFPGRAIPKADWGFVGNDNPTLRKFAEAREALVALQKGGFSAGFPSITSDYDQWDAVSSIAYLAGVRNRNFHSQRLSPRPVEKLNAFVLRAASGVEAVGLDAAGFRVQATYTSMLPGKPRGGTTLPSERTKIVAYDTARAPKLKFKELALKRPGRRKLNSWNVRRLQIDSDGFASELNRQIDRLGHKDVHLLAATLRDQPFKERGRGADDERQQFGLAFQLIQANRPKAFFFECAAEFLGPKHIPFRNKLVRQAEELGYIVEDFELNASMFGVPQDRPRSVLMGVAKEFGTRFRPPVLTNPIKLTLGEVISDAAFGFLPEIKAIPEEERTPDQIRYKKWAQDWLDQHGKKLVPDTLSLIRGSSNTFDRWHEFGFIINESHTVKPLIEDLHTDSVPLSFQILKRLQGIPDDWKFSGSDEDQRAQLCETTPPVIYRVIGHIIHAALTGEDVDINQAARLRLDSKRWKTASGFHSLAESRNPAHNRALEWHEHILREEAGP